MERNSVRRAKKGESQAKIKADGRGEARSKGGESGQRPAQCIGGGGERRSTATAWRRMAGWGSWGTEEYANDARCMCRQDVG